MRVPHKLSDQNGQRSVGAPPGLDGPRRVWVTQSEQQASVYQFCHLKKTAQRKVIRVARPHNRGQALRSVVSVLSEVSAPEVTPQDSTNKAVKADPSSGRLS